MSKLTNDSFIEITDKYNKKGFLVERYCIIDGEKKDLSIPKFFQINPVVSFYNPKINYELCKAEKYPSWECLKHGTFGDSTLGCAYCGKIKNNLLEKMILPIVHLYRRTKHFLLKGK